MPAISGANPIVASDVDNFTGELFKITPTRTPLLAASGGLNGGIVTNATFFQFQTQDNVTVSSVTPGAEGGQPNYSGQSRSSVQGVLEIFHEAVQISFSAQAASGEIVPFDLSANYKNGIDKLALEGINAITDELAYQMSLLLETVAKKVEYQAFNGTFNDGSTGGQNRQMRGLQAHVNLTGGNWEYHDTNGDGSGSNQKLLDLNNEVIKGTAASGSTNYGILPRDRNVGGIDIDTLVTPFGTIGMALSDYLPANRCYIADLAFIKPVFLNIPGYGTMFVRDIDQDDYARMAKAVYMEMGFDFGPQQYHGEIKYVA